VTDPRARVFASKSLSLTDERQPATEISRSHITNDCVPKMTAHGVYSRVPFSGLATIS
jgi:hypothetical protein